jgi:hypothetical protein
MIAVSSGPRPNGERRAPLSAGMRGARPGGGGPLGGEEIRRGQLARLLELMNRPNISVQVLPLEAGAAC